MTTALYMDKGRLQVVLTAENDMDKQVLARIQRHPGKIAVERGEFYPCRGGWTRHQEPGESMVSWAHKADDSIFLVLDEAQETAAPSMPPPVIDLNLQLLREIWGSLSYGGGCITVPHNCRAFILTAATNKLLDEACKS